LVFLFSGNFKELSLLASFLKCISLRFDWLYLIGWNDMLLDKISNDHPKWGMKIESLKGL